MEQVTMQGIRKRHRAVDVIKGIDLDVRDGDFPVCAGPPGCGKSTTRRMIARLQAIPSGELLIDGPCAIEQRGAPLQLCNRPASAWVAGFSGAPVHQPRRAAGRRCAGRASRAVEAAVGRRTRRRAAGRAGSGRGVGAAVRGRRAAGGLTRRNRSRSNRR
jgi:ABC-type sugar transport system ATPase subunit